MKNKSSILIIVGIVLISISSIMILTKNSKRSSIFKGREYRTSYSIKSFDLESKTVYTISAIDNNPFYCSYNTSFKAFCQGEHYQIEFSNERESQDVKSVISYAKNNSKSFEEIQCIENATCYKVLRGNTTEKDEDVLEFIIYYKGGSNSIDNIKIKYIFYNLSYEKYIPDILKSFKISHDAKSTYTTIEDDKLHVHLKYNTDENPKAYLDLYLDKNKYKEIPSISSDCDHVVVKTENSHDINLYIAYNATSRANEKNYIVSDAYAPFSFYLVDTDKKKSSFYAPSKRGNSTIYTYDSPYKPNYSSFMAGIDNGDEVMLIVYSESKKDEELLDDFLDFKGYNRYKKLGY